MNNDVPLIIERQPGKAAGTEIFLITGPITLPNIFELQAELRRSELPRISILDMSAVPYMDSAGMGAVINYYTHCERLGTRMVVAGVSKRVSELFRMTRVDTVIPMASTADEAERDLYAAAAIQSRLDSA
jgi:anti-sigma B factor antagonist